MSDDFLHSHALIRARITPEMKQVAVAIIEKNLIGIFKGQVRMEEVVESMLMAVEEKRQGLTR